MHINCICARINACMNSLMRSNIMPLQAACGAIRCYLKLYDAPAEASGDEEDAEVDVVALVLLDHCMCIVCMAQLVVDCNHAETLTTIVDWHRTS